jgi:hypothetical protein
MDSKWPEWVLEPASRIQDSGVLDELEARLEAAGFSRNDLRSESNRVGVFLGMSVPENGDALDTLFRLIDAEQSRHERAAAKIAEAKARQRATDARDKRAAKLQDDFARKLPP